MRTITKNYEVYRYSELSEEAKAKVKVWYLDDPFRAAEFEDIYMDVLKTLFPNSDLKMQFSLSWCQGDGLNIYGELDLMDVFLVMRDNSGDTENLRALGHYISEKKQRTIEAYMEICGRIVELPYNRSGYTYCVADRVDFAEEWIEELEYCRYKNIEVDTICRMEKIVGDMFTSLSKMYEEYGYKFLYEVDDEEIEETCEANDWEFLEDGSFYTE